MEYIFGYRDKNGKPIPVSFEIQIDLIQKVILTSKNFYEAPLLRFIETRFEEDLVFVDAGANMGNHSIFFSKICNAKKVYAFEPYMPNIALLKKNLAYNNITNVRLCEFGLGDKEYKAKAITIYAMENSGNIHLARDNKGSIRVSTLDSVFNNGLSVNIDVIKIDVQDMELDVLGGAKNLIKKQTPYIFAEVRRSSKHKYCDPEVFKFLEKFGYKEICVFGGPPAVVVFYAVDWPE